MPPVCSSPEAVTIVTVFVHLRSQHIYEGASMPILMIALFALAAFGLIGILPTAAAVWETKNANSNQSRNSVNKPLA